MENLSALLEQLDAIDQPKTVDDEARGVLRFTLGLAGRQAPSVLDPNTCPNCDKLCVNLRSPYCCGWCKEQASMVRQFRSNLASGAILEAEKQAVYGQILWWLLGGGYPRRVAIVTESGRRQALKATGGLCACGQPAVTFDHKGSNATAP